MLDVARKRTPQTHRKDEFTLCNRDFQFLCKLVYEHTGIVLGESKREMLYRRLIRRTRETKCLSFKDYCSLLKIADSPETPKFINAITTNHTSFFREPHHFDYLRNVFFPKVVQHNSKEKRLRIWSAGCSTGEEPYSIAITLMESLGKLIGTWDMRILATDLDTDVLAQAQAASYPYDRISDLPEKVKRKWFIRNQSGSADNVKINSRLEELITFKPLNLLHEWPMRGPFDIIFCRNVIIYFDRATQNDLISRYRELLRPDGLLILGHSECISKQIHQFDLQGKTIFRR